MAMPFPRLVKMHRGSVDGEDTVVHARYADATALTSRFPIQVRDLWDATIGGGGFLDGSDSGSSYGDC